jgi:thioesterase domain-containing protein
MDAKTLEAVLHREVPLTAHMGVRVVSIDTDELIISADLQPNINIHGTAFGGSLYSICAIACWAMLHIQSLRAGLSVHSVLGSAEINYDHPVRGVIEARCALPQSDRFDAYLQRLAQGQKAAIEMRASVLTAKGEAVEFKGRYSTYF